MIKASRMSGSCAVRNHSQCKVVISMGPGVRGFRKCQCPCHRVASLTERQAEQLLTGQEP